MPYHVGAKGSHGCSGYPAVKDTGEVMGCHKTRSAAAGQIYAINVSEGNIGKAMPNLVEGDYAITAHGEDEFHIGQVVHVMREGSLGNPETDYFMEATPENPAVMIQLFEQDETGYWKATRLYTACAMSMYIKIDPLQVEPSVDEETDMQMSNNIGCCDESVEKKAPCWEGYVQRGMKEKNGKMVPNCIPVEKTIWEGSAFDRKKR